MLGHAFKSQTLAATLAGAVLALGAASLGSAASEPLNRQSVFFDPAAPVLGNPDGDVSIATYVDYQCPYCRAMHPTLMKVVHEDGNVRLVAKDWPIFGAPSRYATEMALAARHQGLYEKAHDSLMRLDGKLTEAAVDAALEAAGVDLARARSDLAANRAEIYALLARTQEQATAFGFAGTPATVIDRFVFPGAMDEAGLKQAISDARGER